MSVYTYHLVKIPFLLALKFFLFRPKYKKIPGLIHGELMTSMKLGSAIFSPSRLRINEIAFFAQWENKTVLDEFLSGNTFGKEFSKGWFVRLKFLRQWGSVSGFNIDDEPLELENKNQTVVAVTVARMKFLQIPRFIRWGRPVEKLVRDHPGTYLSLASLKLPNTISTFSIWKSQDEMTDMVRGHSSVPKPKRHIDAMKERERKDFHYEFTTLRFLPLEEFGSWNGKTCIIPNLK
jgi:hypothetical protein